MGQPDLSFLLRGMEPPQPPGDATSPAGMPERRSPERASMWSIFSGSGSSATLPKKG